MQKNILYSITFGVLALFLVFIVFDDSSEENSINIENDNEDDIVFIKDKSDEIRQNIKIKYSKSETKKEKSKISETKGKKQTKEILQAIEQYQKKAPVPTGEKKYSISTSTTKAGQYTFKISSSSQIAKANPEAFPMLPAFIKGKIDGVAYSIVIPVDLNNKDLSINIANEETGETKELPFSINDLRSGSNVEMDIDYDNIDNYHIKKENSIIGPPAPPIKTIPKKAPPRLPGQS